MSEQPAQNNEQRIGNMKGEELLTLINAVVEAKEKGRDTHWTVKVFGSAILSIVALVVLGAFQSAFQGIKDCNDGMRNQIGKFVSKEDYNNRVQSIWGGIKECQQDRAELAAAKERLKTLETQNQAREQTA